MKRSALCAILALLSLPCWADTITYYSNESDWLAAVGPATTPNISTIDISAVVHTHGQWFVGLVNPGPLHPSYVHDVSTPTLVFASVNIGVCEMDPPENDCPFFEKVTLTFPELIKGFAYNNNGAMIYLSSDTPFTSFTFNFNVDGDFFMYITNVEYAPVDNTPEPATLMFLSTGIVGGFTRMGFRKED